MVFFVKRTTVPLQNRKPSSVVCCSYSISCLFPLKQSPSSALTPLGQIKQSKNKSSCAHIVKIWFCVYITHRSEEIGNMSKQLLSKIVDQSFDNVFSCLLQPCVFVLREQFDLEHKICRSSRRHQPRSGTLSTQNSQILIRQQREGPHLKTTFHGWRKQRLTGRKKARGTQRMGWKKGN